MTWIIGDSFDFYATVTDAALGTWDSVGINNGLGTGRFTGSRAWAWGTTNAATGATKTSGSNDATHHLVLAYFQSVLTATSPQLYFTLFDGTNAQCSIVFRSDGAILLTSGGPTGTTLATYTSAFLGAVWTAFEFEVTINNTTGAFHIRKNGNAADDFVATALNTRAGSTNNYANKLQFGNQSNTACTVSFDDFLWFNTTGTAPNTWVGDVRAVQLMPTADTATKAFAPTSAALSITPFVQNITSSKAANNGIMGPFTASFTGTIGSVQLQVTTGGTGNLKAAIYDSARAAIIATSNALVNPIAGTNTIVFGTPFAVTKGTTYNVAFDTDFTIIYAGCSSGLGGWFFTTTYASFPAAGPVLTAILAPIFTVTITPTVNAEFVNEAQEDGDTTYVFDNVVGHNDLYNVADLATVPLSVVAVQTRGFVKKTDAGARSAELQLKSGATTVTTTPLLLSTSYQYTSRIDTVDPNTSTAWTGTSINAIQIGPVVQA